MTTGNKFFGNLFNMLWIQRGIERLKCDDQSLPGINAILLIFHYPLYCLESIVWVIHHSKMLPVYLLTALQQGHEVEIVHPQFPQIFQVLPHALQITGKLLSINHVSQQLSECGFIHGSIPVLPPCKEADNSANSASEAVSSLLPLQASPSARPSWSLQ